MKNRLPARCFHPGVSVKDEMEARGWTVEELAQRMSRYEMPVEIAVAVIEGKQDITINIAFGLRRAFGTSAEFWMNLQGFYNAWKEAKQDNPRSI